MTCSVIFAKTSSLSSFQKADTWFAASNRKPFPFQYEMWENYLQGYSGILNAATGSGKTLAAWVPVVLEALQSQEKVKGLKVIWITPLRALAKDIHAALQSSAKEMGLNWRVELRTGDVSSAKKKKQIEKFPDALITTPESLHLLLSLGNSKEIFKHLEAVIVDEWHELLGTKRGVLVELVLSRLKTFSRHQLRNSDINYRLKIWGISATIGNLKQAQDVLLGNNYSGKNAMVVSTIKKRINIQTVIPDEIEKYPWAGHLGIKLIHKVLPLIESSRSSLIFTNTRGQAEIWYQKLLEAAPDLAGTIAIHHGSLSKEIRNWVEQSLRNGKLKGVVCTSSLDLGVDFSTVDNVIQVGSPKGMARFIQRAGRSGHQPSAVSNIFFVPTHSLELIEGAAVHDGVRLEISEERIPLHKPIDVLVQYLVTLAVGDGFTYRQVFEEIKTTEAFNDLTEEEFQWCLQYITTGGSSLDQYNEFSKVEEADGLFKVHDRKIALWHRLNIGTIVSEMSMQVRYMSGGRVGTIEEWFISRLNPNDVFWLAGKCLSLALVKGNVAYVRKVKSTKGAIPSWQGGRMPLSSQLSALIREQIDQVKHHSEVHTELKKLRPLFDLQEQLSVIPGKQDFLIEKIKTDEGCHCFFYPFEGRLVHEGMAALIAHRLAMLKPISFSMAMNDYGFELMSDTDIHIETAIEKKLFDTEHLIHDIFASVNATEMAKKKFREIARVAGLVFAGFPGKMQKERHLQTSTELLFKVLSEYDPKNLLLKQCYDEVLEFQFEEYRLRKALMRINRQKIIVTTPDQPTPLSFPIMVDRLREKLSSEKLESRIKKMQLKFAK